jgi:hypothetical protein
MNQTNFCFAFCHLWIRHRSVHKVAGNLQTIRKNLVRIDAEGRETEFFCSLAIFPLTPRFSGVTERAGTKINCFNSFHVLDSRAEKFFPAPESETLQHLTLTLS